VKRERLHLSIIQSHISHQGVCIARTIAPSVGPRVVLCATNDNLCISIDRQH